MRMTANGTGWIPVRPEKLVTKRKPTTYTSVKAKGKCGPLQEYFPDLESLKITYLNLCHSLGTF